MSRNQRAPCGRNQDPLGKSLPWEPRGQTVIGVVRNASTAYA